MATELVPREGEGSAERNKRKSRSEKSKGIEKGTEEKGMEEMREADGTRVKVQTLKVRGKEHGEEEKRCLEQNGSATWRDRENMEKLGKQ